MSRRMEVELTSARPDGTWTWRQAGAREPKGVVEGSLVPPDTKVGDILRAEVEQTIDAITITAFLGARPSRREPELLPLLGEARPFEPVTSVLTGRGERRERRDRDRPPRREGERPRRDEGDRRPRGERPSAERPGREGREGRGEGRPERARTERPRGARPERAPRQPRPEPEPRPKPKKLRPGRAHRQALLAGLPDEHKPIAEQLLRGGIPAVRQALDEQNAALRAEGKPEVKAGGVLALAEDLLPKVRTAEWRDRAEAALADVDELDLKDLRQVVATATDAARDDETRALAAQLREALSRRQDAAHQEWLAEITAALAEGRAVRALRLSSRPPKPGVPFPADLFARLAEAAAASLTAEATAERWVAVVEALAYAPVHGAVSPQTVPEPVPAEVTQAVTRLAPLVPQVAKALGIEVPADARAPRPPRRPGPPRERKPAPPAAAAPAVAEPATQAADAPAAPESEAEPVAEPVGEPAPEA